MTPGPVLRWAPPGLLCLGLVLLLSANAQRAIPLRAPLQSSVPVNLAGYVGKDVKISDDERRVAGMDDYLFRIYSTPADSMSAYTVYVGYYETQRQGRTIHSPKNCLPGAGWEALTSSTLAIPTAQGTKRVNRYLLQNDKQLALVLYWYQGRGRIEANEYRVKWNLLQDSALRTRSDEALVRIIVPVRGSQDEAQALAAKVATQLIPAVGKALPT